MNIQGKTLAPFSGESANVMDHSIPRVAPAGTSDLSTSLTLCSSLRGSAVGQTSRSGVSAGRSGISDVMKPTMPVDGACRVERPERSPHPLLGPARNHY
jgi:hypothetical protein